MQNQLYSHCSVCDICDAEQWEASIEAKPEGYIPHELVLFDSWDSADEYHRNLDNLEQEKIHPIGINLSINTSRQSDGIYLIFRVTTTITSSWTHALSRNVTSMAEVFERR